MTSSDQLRARLSRALGDDDPGALADALEWATAEQQQLTALTDATRAWLDAYLSRGVSQIGAPARVEMQRLDEALSRVVDGTPRVD